MIAKSIKIITFSHFLQNILYICARIGKRVPGTEPDNTRQNQLRTNKKQIIKV